MGAIGGRFFEKLKNPPKISKKRAKLPAFLVHLQGLEPISSVYL